MDYLERTPEVYRNRGTLLMYWAVRAVLIVAMIVYAYTHEYASFVASTLIFVLILLPSIFKKNYMIRLPFVLDLSIGLFVFCDLFLGEVVQLYNHLVWWDKVLHFQSGLLLAIVGFTLIFSLAEPRKVLRDIPLGLLGLFAVSFSVLSAVVWEIGEYVGDGMFKSLWQLNGNDTMWDLITNLLGALIIGTIGYFWLRQYKNKNHILPDIQQS